MQTAADIESGKPIYINGKNFGTSDHFKVPKGQWSTTLVLLLAGILFVAPILGFMSFAVHMFNNPNTTPTDEKYYEIAKINYKSWNDALKSKNPDNVSILYENGGGLTFLPTKSPIMITKVNDGIDSKNGSPLEDAKDYFTAFLKNNPDGTVVDEFVMGLNTYPLDTDGAAYLHSGVYRFTIGGNPNNTIRFSFVWKKTGSGSGGWKIQHHHSSIAESAMALPKWVTDAAPLGA